MKRMHVHVAVDDLQRSIRFYSALFAAEPSITKPDYAKWMLEDPRVKLRNLSAGPPSRSRSPRHSGRRHGGIE